MAPLATAMRRHGAISICKVCVNIDTPKPLHGVPRSNSATIHDRVWTIRRPLGAGTRPRRPTPLSRVSRHACALTAAGPHDLSIDSLLTRAPRSRGQGDQGAQRHGRRPTPRTTSPTCRRRQREGDAPRPLGCRSGVDLLLSGRWHAAAAFRSRDSVLTGGLRSVSSVCCPAPRKCPAISAMRAATFP